jgi:hypothetical protein
MEEGLKEAGAFSSSGAGGSQGLKPGRLRRPLESTRRKTRRFIMLQGARISKNCLNTWRTERLALGSRRGLRPTNGRAILEGRVNINTISPRGSSSVPGILIERTFFLPPIPRHLNKLADALATLRRPLFFSDRGAYLGASSREVTCSSSVKVVIAVLRRSSPSSFAVSLSPFL